MVGVLFLTILSTYMFFINNTGDIYEKRAVENIIDVKKDFLKSIVDNLIIEIEAIETQEKEYYTKRTNYAASILDEYYSLSPNKYIDKFIDFSRAGENKGSLSVLIRDLESDELVYESGLFIGHSPQVDEFTSYTERTYDNYKIIFAVSNDYIEQVTKWKVAKVIYKRKFAQESYIWVNEIIDYRGGKDYARRVIHPNFVSTEGQYLSTDMQDDGGNYPYQEELDGINKDGQVFFNYQFKKKNSDVISEQVTYAKLYEKYHWVIAMGIYLDDIETYISQVTQDKNEIFVKTTRQTILFMILIFLVYLFISSQIERWYYYNSNKKLKAEVYIDSLTGARNRKSATLYLESAFKKFKKTKNTPMIMMLDIDDFKLINDRYGHIEGDRVLKNVAEVINNHIRDTDTLYRWGGEEFLLVSSDLKEKDIIPFSNKIISIVNQDEYDFDGKKYRATVSMGIDYFKIEDTSYEDAIKRADLAMYHAKKLGKNRACLWNVWGINPLDD